MAMRGAIAYSAFRRSKTHLVYTTEDLRVRFVDRTHFFGRAHPEKRAYAPPVGKVGLESCAKSHESTRLSCGKALKSHYRANGSGRTCLHSAPSPRAKHERPAEVPGVRLRS